MSKGWLYNNLMLLMTGGIFMLMSMAPVLGAPVVLGDGHDGPDIDVDEEWDEVVTGEGSGAEAYRLLLASPLYSKLNESRLLDNDTRARVFVYILENPGANQATMSRDLRVKRGTLAHHLHILEREGRIRSVKTGKAKRYYEAGQRGSGLCEIQEAIIGVVKERPGISQVEIARELGLSRQVVNYHVKSMVAAKALRVERDGLVSSCRLP